jgi:hypothetical protein
MRDTEKPSRWLGVAAALALLLSGGISLQAGEPSNYVAGSMKNDRIVARAIPAVAIPATDPACKPVYDANDKLLTTDYHAFMNQIDSNGKATTNIEPLNVGGVRYVLVGGKWSRSGITTEQMKQQEDENKKNAKNNSCHYLRDESVNGQAAAVYSEHSESDAGKSDAQIWISKTKGLIVKEEIDLEVNGVAGKNHMAIRYEYGSVHAPAV